jgi:hypothetical protein
MGDYPPCHLLYQPPSSERIEWALRPVRKVDSKLNRNSSMAFNGTLYLGFILVGLIYSYEAFF